MTRPAMDLADYKNEELMQELIETFTETINAYRELFDMLVRQVPDSDTLLYAAKLVQEGGDPENVARAKAIAIACVRVCASFKRLSTAPVISNPFAHRH